MIVIDDSFFRFLISANNFVLNFNRISEPNGGQFGALSNPAEPKQFPGVFAVKSPFGGTMLLTQDFADKFRLPDSVRFYDSVLTCQ